MKAKNREGRLSSVVSALRAMTFCVAVVSTIGGDWRVFAQETEWQLVPPDQVPPSGTFMSMQMTNLPPLPWNQAPGVNVYWSSNFPNWLWLDDRGVDYEELRQQRQFERALLGLETLQGPPLPPGEWGNGGGQETNGSGGAGFSYPENSLWLSIAHLTNGEAPITLHGTVQEWLYEIQSTPVVPDGSWSSEGGVLGALGQNWTLTWVPVGSRTNELFFRARLWTDCDGYGTAPAWYVQNGLNPLTPGIATADADADGLLNWQEYRIGNNPQASEGFGVWVSSPSGYSGLP